jgi:hypothetical protein
VISGTIGTSAGEKLVKKGDAETGSLVRIPGKHAHYAWTGNEEAKLQSGARAGAQGSLAASLRADGGP